MFFDILLSLLILHLSLKSLGSEYLRVVEIELGGGVLGPSLIIQVQ